MSRYLPDLSGIFCLVIFFTLLTSTNDALLRDGDTFWHIKAGTVMLEQQALLERDIFSHTAYGTPWTAHEWLAEIIMAGIHTLAGLEGLFCFFVLVISLSFWLLYRITEKHAGPLVTMVAMIIPLAFSQSHMAARPHIFTWLFMLLTLTIIRAGNKHLFWLPVITVIWANLHGGFILGIVLQGIFICGNVINEVSFRGNSLRERFTRQKRPLLVMALCTLSVGLNPFGYELLLFPFQVSKGVFSTLIGEWASPDLKSMWYFTAYLFFSAVLLLIPKSKATWTDRLLFLFFLQASLTHIRHISIMTMAMTPSLAMMFSNVFFRRQSASNTNPKQQLKLSSKTGPLLTVTAAVMVISIIVINPHTRGLLSPLEIFSAPKAELQQLSAYLDSNPPRGRMFNEYNLGGYLLYSLGSQAKVFIDGRADMYGEQIISDYNTIQSEQSGREELLKKYSIDWIVFDKHSTIIHDLGQSGHWRETFSNNRYAVLIRR